MTTFLKRQTKDEIVTRFLSRTDPKQSRYCRHKSDSFLEA